jgi:hypothetical protein
LAGQAGGADSRKLTSIATEGEEPPASRRLRSASGFMVPGMLKHEGSATAAEDRPWLLDLAATQEDSGPDPGNPVYDDEAQMTYLREPAYELAIESERAVSTKKADRETGEDQKGF